MGQCQLRTEALPAPGLAHTPAGKAGKAEETASNRGREGGKSGDGAPSDVWGEDTGGL